jgi:hypothetical protein
MAVPCVFISFASEDAPWKGNFVQPLWFSSQMGNVKIVDYQEGDNLPFGPLNEWLEQELEAAAAVVCIVSEHYIAKRYTLKEWSLGLGEVKRGRLIFVPVMIDAEAKEWWKKQKQEGKIRDLGEDYAYADFTRNGKPTPIVSDVGYVIDSVAQRISELARLIACRLLEPPKVVEAQARVVDRPIVVLGHPISVASEVVERNVNDLTAALTADKLAPTRWKNGWRMMQDGSHGPTAILQKRPFVVQPVGPVEAGDHARTPVLLGGWLEQAMAQEAGAAGWLAGCGLVLWLPQELQDREFETALAKQAAGANPVLKHDSPITLAQWLGNQARGARPDTAVLTLEELSDIKDSGKLREALHEGFYDLVGEVVNPAPERWLFSGEMLVEQLKALDTDRVIIAVHDLNTGTAREQRQARVELEQKLGAISLAVNQATRDQPRKLKLFRAALLVAKADQLPWVKYPKPSQFEDWCLLPFSEVDNALKPKPQQADVFRSYLREWAAVH